MELSNKINNMDARKFKMHNFVYQKKKKNLMKYGDHSKLNEVAMPVPKGTISIMMNTRKENCLFTIKNMKNNKYEKSKFKIKWKTIQWLTYNRKDGVDFIVENGKEIFEEYCNEKYYEVTTLNQFLDILDYAGLGGESTTAEKIYE
jgi:hypothetical protein